MILILLLALALVPACLAQPDCESCSLSFAPVCKDGVVEYQNECLARCQGVENPSGGPCPDPAGSAAGIMNRGGAHTTNGYNTEGKVTKAQMHEMSKLGYHLTGRIQWASGFKMNNQAEDGKSDDAKASPSQRLQVAIDYATGFVYTQSKVAAAPTKTTEFAASFMPTGAKVGGSKGPETGHGRSLVVIGSDNRIQINYDAYPYRAGAYLSLGNGLYCSAAMIGPQIAITTGSCIYNRASSSWYNLGTMRVTPGLRSGGVANYGSTTVRRAVTYKGYTRDGLTRYNIAVLYLGSNIGYKSGWYGIGYKCGAATYNFQKIGYSSDKPPRTMWWSPCSVYKDMCSESDLYHDCDTYSGDTGAGMWQWSDKRVRAVHVGWVTLSGGRRRNVAATVRPNTWSIFKEAIETTPR